MVVGCTQAAVVRTDVQAPRSRHMVAVAHWVPDSWLVLDKLRYLKYQKQAQKTREIWYSSDMQDNSLVCCIIEVFLS
jgi:hypothetical protein